MDTRNLEEMSRCLPDTRADVEMMKSTAGYREWYGWASGRCRLAAPFVVHVTRRASAEQRPDDLDRDDHDELGDRHRREEPERGAPAAPPPDGPRARRLRHDEVRDDAPDDEHERRRTTTSASRRRSPPGSVAPRGEGHVVGEVRDGEHDRDDEARQHGPDDRPRRVAELAPADLRPRALADRRPTRLSHRRGSSASGGAGASPACGAASSSTASREPLQLRPRS